jgi:uncharacterized protein YkwD
MPRRPRRLACAVALAAAVLAASAPAPASAQDCPFAGIQATADNLPTFTRAVVCLVNVERLERDRRPLDIDSRLVLAGTRHATDMVARDYFSHFTPAGADIAARLRRVGYLPTRGWWMAGEVLAWGVFWRATPRATVDAWFDSPPHKEALLEPGFREIGAGAVAGSPGRQDEPGVTVAAELGRDH